MKNGINAPEEGVECIDGDCDKRFIDGDVEEIKLDMGFWLVGFIAKVDGEAVDGDDVDKTDGDEEDG